MGSIVRSGSDPWPPCPIISILKVSAEALIGPSCIEAVPNSKALFI